MSHHEENWTCFSQNMWDFHYRFVPVFRVHTSPYNTVYIAYDLKYWDQSAFMCKINHILLKQYEFTILCSINSIFCDAWLYQFYLQFKVLTVSMYLRICYDPSDYDMIFDRKKDFSTLNNVIHPWIKLFCIKTITKLYSCHLYDFV